MITALVVATILALVIAIVVGIRRVNGDNLTESAEISKHFVPVPGAELGDD